MSDAGDLQAYVATAPRGHRSVDNPDEDTRPGAGRMRSRPGEDDLESLSPGLRNRTSARGSNNRDDDTDYYEKPGPRSNRRPMRRGGERGGGRRMGTRGNAPDGDDEDEHGYGEGGCPSASRGCRRNQPRRSGGRSFAHSFGSGAAGPSGAGVGMGNGLPDGMPTGTLNGQLMENTPFGILPVRVIDRELLPRCRECSPAKDIILELAEAIFNEADFYMDDPDEVVHEALHTGHIVQQAPGVFLLTEEFLYGSQLPRGMPASGRRNVIDLNMERRREQWQMAQMMHGRW